jgi:hypothetical protein
MKSGNYNEFLDKFYAGIATAEEISLLQSEELINEQDLLYAETLREEREHKMDWEFEDLMNDIASEKVVAFPARKTGMKRILLAAAMIAAIVTSYIFWTQRQTNRVENVPIANKIPDSNTELTTTAESPANEIKDTAVTTQKVNKAREKNTDHAVTVHKKRPVEKGIIPADKTDSGSNKNLKDYLVIVNGKPITNEADAVAITRASLGIVSRNLTITVDELKPISRIKIKL